MNVQPGDFARVIGSLIGNDGCLCYIEHLPGEWDDGEWMWQVTLLEPALVSDGARACRQEAGSMCRANDARLRRVDPPPSEDSTEREREEETQ